MPSDERRLFPRRRALRGASIVFNQASSTIDCVVTNQSDSGVRLDVKSPLGIPQTFELKLVGQTTRRICEVVWRRPGGIGARYASL